MSDSGKTNEQEPTKATDEQAQKPEDSSTHPICQNAKDPEKCEEFAERLGEASDNIDKRVD